MITTILSGCSQSWSTWFLSSRCLFQCCHSFYSSSHFFLNLCHFPFSKVLSHWPHHSGIKFWCIYITNSNTTSYRSLSNYCHSCSNIDGHTRHYIKTLDVYNTILRHNSWCLQRWNSPDWKDIIEHTAVAKAQVKNDTARGRRRPYLQVISAIK